MMNNRNMTILTGVVCLLPAAAGLIVYGSLPAELPVQWSFSGEANSYAPKWFAAFGMPVFLFLFNIFCHWKVNSADAELSYPETAKVFIKWAMPFISAGITSFSLASALEVSAWMALIISIISVVLVLFGCLVYEGNADGMGNRNFPWSRSVGAAKKAGKVMMAAGMIAVVVSVIGKTTAGLVIIVVGVIAASGLAVRSDS